MAVISSILPFIGLTGGSQGDLDAKDGASLIDGQAAMVVTDAGTYWYHLNASSGASLLAPFRIPPLTNPSTKVWHLVGTTVRIGALVKLSSDQEIPNNSTTPIDWETEQYDDADFWAIGANSTKLIIPVGVVGVKISCNVQWETGGGGADLAVEFSLNGSAAYGLPRVQKKLTLRGLTSLSSTEIPVIATDYFTCAVYHNTGAPFDLTAGELTWFSIEATNFA